MGLVLKLKADSFYDGVELLKSQLFQARVDIFSDDFYIKSLGKGIYRIHLSNPSENYEQIFRQWGKIID